MRLILSALVALALLAAPAASVAAPTRPPCNEFKNHPPGPHGEDWEACKAERDRKAH